MDAFGHVNNNTIFSLYDNAKYQYLTDLFGEQFFDGRGIVVVNLKAEFFSPIFYPGNIRTGTSITRVGNKSITFFQQMIDPETLETRCECTTIMVLYDVHARKSIEIPQEIKKAILEYEHTI